MSLHSGSTNSSISGVPSVNLKIYLNNFVGKLNKNQHYLVNNIIDIIELE